MIFRDTLVRDFGDDPQRLREQVKRVVRHEIGHYLGFDEEGVRKLGL
jgi:predicted Zn-dependent protease with MMP-like domain